MILVSYDIASDKLRAQFAKYLLKFGHRIQYSVYEIDNAKSFLNTVEADISSKWEKQFGQSDSVYVFNLSKLCKVIRFGYAKHEDKEVIIV